MSDDDKGMALILAGAKAVGTLQHLDENGAIPSYARDTVLAVIQQWLDAAAEKTC